MSEQPPIFGSGVIFGQLASEWEERNEYMGLVDQGPMRLSGWPKIDRCIFRDGGFVIVADSLELHFDLTLPSRGHYSRGRESGRVHRVTDLAGPEFLRYCPDVLREFRYRFFIVTISETSPIGTKQVWIAGFDENSN